MTRQRDLSPRTILGAIVTPISFAATGPLADHYGSLLLLTAAATRVRRTVDARA